MSTSALCEWRQQTEAARRAAEAADLPALLCALERRQALLPALRRAALRSSDAAELRVAQVELFERIAPLRDAVRRDLRAVRSAREKLQRSAPTRAPRLASVRA